jgi:zinc ribbon protein
MRKWFALLGLLGVLAFPFSVHAQNPVKLSTLQVQLWPEYDRPGMLVINYITLSADTALPAAVLLHMPATASKPSALAVGQTLDTVTDQGVQFTTKTAGDWLDISLTASGPAIQLEYYDPIRKAGDGHNYLYQWLGDYQIDSFSLTVQQPAGATDLRTSPVLGASETRNDGLTYYSSDFGALPAGKSFSLTVSYQKAGDALSVSSPQVQSSEPLSSDTPGRVMLSNYLPYILGGIGLVLIVGGVVYFWQSSRGDKSGGRKKHAGRDRDEAASDVYCHQCGTRARLGDRFCRVCGTKLRTGA